MRQKYANIFMKDSMI